MNQILLKKLLKYAKQISYSQMENLTFDMFRKVLGVDDKSIQLFINELHDDRLIEYKYNVICKMCKKEDTIYEYEIPDITQECYNCGNMYDIKDAIKKGSILYSIPRDEFLSFCKDEQIDHISESIKLIDIETKRLKHNNDKKINNTEDGVLTIFIGSSKEAIPDMETIGLYLEQIGHKHLLWNKVDEFVAGDTTLESIIDITDKVDAALFIFNGEDETWYRGNKELTVRDNVLLEYGIFIGAKGRKNSVFACKNEPKIPTDLLGINYIDLSLGELQIKSKLRAWLEKIS